MKVLVQDGFQCGGKDFFVRRKGHAKHISIPMFKPMSEMRKERREKSGKM